MRAADYLVDIGPGAGEHGGQIIAAGTVEEVMKVENSITGQYLSGRKFIALPEDAANQARIASKFAVRRKIIYIILM